jgi:predicted MFS family arabinose efflux permease
MNQHSATAFDVNRRVAIATTTYLGMVGVLSYLIQPGLVEGYVDTLHMSPAQANDVVGIEMIGVALASTVLATVGDRIDWRQLLRGALVLAVIGNLASAVLTKSTLFPSLRFVAGLGHGAIISLSFTFIGLTARPDRNIAIFIVSLQTYGAAGLFLLPTILSGFGFAPVFLSFALLAAVGFYLIDEVPKSSQSRSIVSPTAIQLRVPSILIALAGVLAYNIAQGVAWTNLALIGTAAHQPDQTVANDLSISQFAAIAGALSSAVLAGFARRGIMLVIGIAGGAASIALLLGFPNGVVFLIAVCGFNFLCSFALPFILSAVGDLDLHGRVMGPAVAMQMIGLGVGPILSARLLSSGSFVQVELSCIVFFCISLALLAIPVAQHELALRTAGRGL